MEGRVGPQLVEIGKPDVSPFREVEEVDLLEGKDNRIDDRVDEPHPEQCRGRR